MAKNNTEKNIILNVIIYNFKIRITDMKHTRDKNETEFYILVNNTFSLFNSTIKIGAKNKNME